MSAKRRPLPPCRQLLPISDVGVVLLGEDGGEGLLRGLAAWLTVPHRVVYADPYVTEELARLLVSCGIQCVSPWRIRDQSKAVCRSEAMREMFRRGAKPAFVQWLRVDSTLSVAWLNKASQYLAANPRVGMVCGGVHVDGEGTARERLRVARANSPAGHCCVFPGEALVRTDAFEMIANIDDRGGALQETEWVDCLLANGWDAVRIAEPMTQWSVESIGWGEWLRQQCRAGCQESRMLARSPAPQVAFARRLRWRWGLASLGGVCGVIGLALAGRPLMACAAGLALLVAAVMAVKMVLYPWQPPAALVQERDRSLADWSVLAVSTALKMCGDLVYAVGRARSRWVPKRFRFLARCIPDRVKLAYGFGL